MLGHTLQEFVHCKQVKGLKQKQSERENKLFFSLGSAAFRRHHHQTPWKVPQSYTVKRNEKR
jgi:hypothetical protein